jgi:hypothetical protein
MFAGKAGAYLSEASFRPYPQIIDLLEKLTSEKDSSVLRKSVNYSHKKFYSTGPWCSKSVKEIKLKSFTVSHKKFYLFIYYGDLVDMNK